VRASPPPSCYAEGMRLFIGLLAVLALAGRAVPAQAAGQVDIALVLAVDTSGSIDADEFELQRAGYVGAFRDRRVIDAIRSGTHGAIAVTYFQWSGARLQQQIVEWTVIDGAASATSFAERLAAAPRQIFGGGTSLSGAIDYGAALLAGSELTAVRRVIDISGDGSNNQGRLAAYARDDAVAAGITINGIAILNDEPLLDIWYAENVVGGPGSFVMATSGFETFATAILDKLVREIAELPDE
jgi:Protein of unknown function (DUF1194)